MRRHYWWAVLLLVALVGLPTVATAAGEGVISGQMVNLTPGGHAVEGIEISLLTFSGDKVVSEQKTTTDASGSFEFKGLALGASNSYQVQAEFQDAFYVSDQIFLDSQTPYQKLGMEVYDSTRDGSAVEASNAHVIVLAGQGDIQVMEVWGFVNKGDKTFIGTPEAGTISFLLPEGATSPTGEGFIPEPSTGMLRDTQALAPGEADVTFSYILPSEGQEMKLSRILDYTVPKFRLLVKDTGVKVTANMLVDGGALDLGGSRYLYFTGQDLVKGSELTVSFSGLAKAQAQAGTGARPFPWAWLVVGVFALGFITTLAYPKLSRRQAMAAARPGPQGPGRHDNDDRRLGMFNELADLDDRFAAGEIQEAEYRSRRATVKARLAAEMQQLKER